LANKSQNSSEQISKSLAEFTSEITIIAKEIHDQSELIHNLQNLFKGIEDAGERSSETASFAQKISDELRGD
jgi:methyl-accepting chemotaxis protein